MNLIGGAGTRSTKRAWYLLGLPSSLSLRAALVYAPFGALGPLLSDPSRLGGSMTTWISIAVLGECVVIATFLALRPIVHRSGRRMSEPLSTLGAVLLAAILRAVAVAGLAVAFGTTDEWELRYRLTSAVVVQTSAMILAGLLVSGNDAHRHLIAELERERGDLMVVDATMQGRLAEMRQGILQQVRDTLVPRMRELEEALAAIDVGGDTSPGLASLRNFVDDEVRPLSHALIDSPEPPSIPRTPAGGPERVRLPRYLSMGAALWPLTTGLLVALAAWSPANRDLATGEALLFCLLEGAGVILLLTAVRWALRSWTPPLPLTVAITTALVALAVGGTPQLLLVIGAPVPAFINMLAFGVGVAIGLFTSLYAAVEADRAKNEVALQETVARLQESVSVLRQQAWMSRRRLSLLLHGSVQSALHAAVLRLGATATASPDVTSAIQHDIQSAIRRLEDVPDEQVAVAGVLRDIAQTWEGMCVVTWTISPAAQASLDSIALLRESTAEIVREGVHNSIVHGAAHDVTVDVGTWDGGLRVTIDDDGRPGSGAPGLGSRMLDEMCVRWERASSARGTRLTADVASPAANHGDEADLHPTVSAATDR